MKWSKKYIILTLIVLVGGIYSSYLINHKLELRIINPDNEVALDKSKLEGNKFKLNLQSTQNNFKLTVPTLKLNRITNIKLLADANFSTSQEKKLEELSWLPERKFIIDEELKNINLDIKQLVTLSNLKVDFYKQIKTSTKDQAGEIELKLNEQILRQAKDKLKQGTS